MDRYGREKEGALAKVKEGYAEREQSLQNTIRDLQSKLEDSQVNIRKLQWSNSDVQKEKEIQAEKLVYYIQYSRCKLVSHWKYNEKNVDKGRQSKKTVKENRRWGQSMSTQEIKPTKLAHFFSCSFNSYYPLANEVVKGYSNATFRPSVLP